MTSHYLQLRKVECVFGPIQAGFGNVTKHGQWTVGLYSHLCDWFVLLHFYGPCEMENAGSPYSTTVDDTKKTWFWPPVWTLAQQN